MPEFGFITIALLVVGVLLPFILGPIVIYFIQQVSAPEFFSLTDDEIDSQTAPDFNARSNAVRDLGFQQVANLQWITPRSRTFSRVFYRRETQEIAHVSDITAFTESKITPPVSVRYMEFVTDFYSCEVYTNNSSNPHVMAVVPEKEIYWMPGVDNAATLYKIHRHLTAAVNDDIKPLPAPEMIGRSIELDSLKGYQRQVEAGYLYYDDACSTYRPTLKGATLMTWKLVWPVAAILRARMKIKARRLERIVNA